MDKRKTANRYLKKLKEDKTVFDDFFRCFYGYIKTVAYYHLIDKNYVNDVVQQTFEAVLAHIQEFDDRMSGYAWMVQIAFNAARTFNKKEKYYDRSDTEENVVEDVYYEDSDGDYNVAKALATLEENDRKIVVLKVFEDKTFEEISRIVNMHPSTVYLHYRKNLKFLREFFENQ